MHIQAAETLMRRRACADGPGLLQLALLLSSTTRGPCLSLLDGADAGAGNRAAPCTPQRQCHGWQAGCLGYRTGTLPAPATKQAAASGSAPCRPPGGGG